MPEHPVRRGESVLSDGRLNLEQQKKRAKELHRGLTAGDNASARRLAANHPKGARLAPWAAQLADAQLVLARENGFDTWPRLKAHIEALEGARAAMDRPEAAPDTRATLHIRCGSDIQEALKRAGFVGAFHQFADPYCQGPVRDLPREAFIAERAGFVARAYGLSPDQALARLSAEYAGLDHLEDHDEVVLWFEHDSYDQLILAFLLAELGGRGLKLSLICADGAPGVARFIGLGQLAPEVIRMQWGTRTVVGPEHRALGAVVWRALTSPSPLDLGQIAAGGTPAVAPMAGALARHLRELPSTLNGLSLTEQIALDLLAENGAMRAQALFQKLTRGRDPLPFLGDAMFWPVLEALAAKPGALTLSTDSAWPERLVEITAVGEQLRTGGLDRLDQGAAPRWVGGVEIRAGRPAWRWDLASSRPVLAWGPNANGPAPRGAGPSANLQPSGGPSLPSG